MSRREIYDHEVDVETLSMPPKLPILSAYCRAAPINSSPFAALLAPFFQSRHASVLGELSDNAGAYNKRIRRGRGPSSGKGKTSGRGHKGQKQHGKVPARMQGGQTPPHIVHGKRGFENQFSVEMSKVNLDKVQEWINQGRLDPTRPITLKELVESRCLHGIKDGVKLLARGKEQFKTPINILVSRASEEAIKAIEAVGGKITTRYYTKLSIKRILQGESESTFTPLAMTPPREAGPQLLAAESPTASPFTYRLPDPTSRKHIEYYRDEAHRGYLSHLVEEGQGPSLFFKTPGTGRRKKTSKVGGTSAATENRVW